MTKSTGNASIRKMFSVFVFPVIIILWLIGWILYSQESSEERSSSTASQFTIHQKNRNTKKNTKPEILEEKIAA